MAFLSKLQCSLHDAKSNGQFSVFTLLGVLVGLFASSHALFSLVYSHIATRAILLKHKITLLPSLLKILQCLPAQSR